MKPFQLMFLTNLFLSCKATLQLKHHHIANSDTAFVQAQSPGYLFMPLLAATMPPLLQADGFDIRCGLAQTDIAALMVRI